MALRRPDLDKMAAMGCQLPGCEHENHDEQIYFNARCHLEAKVEAHYRTPTELEFCCHGCGKFVCIVAVKEHTEIKRCHLKAALDVEYTKDRGTLHIACHECNTLLAVVPVA